MGFGDRKPKTSHRKLEKQQPRVHNAETFGKTHPTCGNLEGRKHIYETRFLNRIRPVCQELSPEARLNTALQAQTERSREYRTFRTWMIPKAADVSIFHLITVGC